jgi:hypothetical protein
VEQKRNSLASLARNIELQRLAEERAEQSEARAFARLGLNWEAVQNARRQRAAEQLAAASQRRGEPYQMAIPGLNTSLMALRSREPLTPEQMQAAGMRAPWHPSPLAAYEQLELGLGQPATVVIPPANNVVPLQMPVVAPPAADAPQIGRFAGDKLAQLVGAGGAGGAAILGALLELLTPPEETTESRS